MTDFSMQNPMAGFAGLDRTSLARTGSFMLIFETHKSSIKFLKICRPFEQQLVQLHKPLRR